jgi:putative heme-binding domain-containing protein
MSADASEGKIVKLLLKPDQWGRMDRKYRLSCILSVGPLACLVFAISLQGQSLPEGRGRVDFERICSSCHTVATATSQRMTRGEWARVVDDMVARGAQGTQDELNNVMTYLVANFGKAGAAAGVTETPVPSVNERPLSEAEIAKGAELLTAKGCLSCHRVGDLGSYLGPDLTMIGARRSWEEIQVALVSPKKDVSPENRGVQLTTGDGKRITGRLLRHDGFSVQVIDSNNQLRSFQKENLRKFAIVTTNPMTLGAIQLNAQELSDLVRYLSSLKGNEKP